MSPPPRPPPALLEELVEEVLLRFPREDPAHLVRAALVCKSWCRLICGRRFRRRFREFHRSAPMLGLICNLVDGDGCCTASFLPTSSFRPLYDEHCRWSVLEARHGRVLLSASSIWSSGLAVCDPLVTDGWWDLPDLSNVFDYQAAVLCAATASGACDHLDCHGHGQPFLAVLVSADHMCLFVYSSEAGSWSEPTPVTPAPDSIDVDDQPTALVGNVLYFAANSGKSILSFDLAMKETSLIHPPPPPHSEDDDYYYTVLTPMEEYGMGVARVEVEESRLSLLSMETGPTGDVRWAQTRVIDLNKLLPTNALWISSCYIAFAPSTGVFFLATDHGLFSVDLKSDQVKKVLEENGIRHVVPYMSFYTPVLGATTAYLGGGPSTCASSATKA